MVRIILAIKAFWRVLRSEDPGAAVAQIESAGKTEGAVPAAQAEGGGELAADAVYTLALLQRGGRLVDFLLENIDSYSDAQVGAAVRQIHAGCRGVLDEHFAVGKVMDGDEGSDVTVPEGFDPSRLRLTGRVSGKAPFSGVLRHPGWCVGKTDFPQRSAQLDPSVIQPAEIEVR